MSTAEPSSQAKPFISIVMGYFNRKSQCLCTLDTINQSVIANRVEVIIVDDASDPEHDLSTIPMKYRFPIKLFKISKNVKTWNNPVVAYNLGISKAVGDWVILQNPEVCHIGDICKFVMERNNPNDYYAFQVFACQDEAQSQMLRERISDQEWVISQLQLASQSLPLATLKGTWYCHPRHRPRAYHFCTAIHRTKLLQVGGFNPAFKDGIDYDDDELLTRIERVCRVNFVPAEAKVYGIHQWHPKFSYQNPNTKALQIRNRMLYQKTVTNRQLIAVNIFMDLPTEVPMVIIGTGHTVVKNNLGSRPLDKSKVIVTVTGIRPDFIRMSEVFKQLDYSFTHIMIHTGQHYDTFLSDAFFRDLNIRAPDYHLETGVNSKNHYEQLSYLSVTLIKCLKDNNVKPDLILFLGDSNTCAAALPLKKEGYKIGHIEAGMRSYDRTMLEELNRTVCDVCSDVFFVYHEDNKKNLLLENIKRPVYVVGNTIVEVCMGELEKLQLLSRRKHHNLILMDVHRPENFNFPVRLQSIFMFANKLMKTFNVPVKCLYFKRLMDQINFHHIDIGNVEMIPLLSYPDYLTLIYHAKLLLSDSGTAQEEPALLNTPVVVPRDHSERPQSYAANCSIKFNVEGDDNSAQIIKWIGQYENNELPVTLDWLGDGNTAAAIIRGVNNYLS